jgi:hypothetical protein
MAKKKSGSSRQEKQFRANELFTTPLTDRQRRELERLARMADSAIDCSDAPAMKKALSDQSWESLPNGRGSVTISRTR